MALRIHDIKLPLDHGDADLRDAVLALLHIPEQDLVELRVARRAYDARKKSAIALLAASRSTAMASSGACGELRA